MKMKQTNLSDYISPSVETVELSSESVLCASDPWYKQGGQGDFDYSIEEEDSWI